MIKADKYIKETIQNIIANGNWDKNPRPKWLDGTPAHSKFITQAVFNYNIEKGEFPITTLRKTALKGAYYDIEAIYQKQTNIIEEMHPSIHSWWKDFSFNRNAYEEAKEWLDKKLPRSGFNIWESGLVDNENFNKEDYHSLGLTYGAIIEKYALMDKLLKGLEENPFGRRHIIDMWQYHEQNRSPKSLVPCAFQTLWSVRDETRFVKAHIGNQYEYEIIRFIDLTLIQRSQDFVMTSSINPTQYVMLGMMVCGHLTHETGILHQLGNFLHIVQNCHIYDRHIDSAKELLNREPINEQPTIKLKENKNFYDYTIDDFEFFVPSGIKKLTNKLEIAV